MSPTLLMVGLATSLVIALVALLVAWNAMKKSRQNARKGDALKLLHQAAEQQNQALRGELAEIRSGAIGVGKRVKELEAALELLQARQDEVAQTDPDAKLYNRAQKMVELGADVEEIMRECELPRAEAQLLVTLHQKGK